ncbi:hypothetical protein ABW19_dt0208414 [Dactylella cylindrospora]|nr:hypothetical protein ABW19_dt0208414 [Dactylella cylindrospora]
MDMGNLVTDSLTGTFTVTLSAHYFKLEQPPYQKSADVILPISRMQSSKGQGSVFVLPNDKSKVTLSIPKNVKKSVLSVIASGNAEEEFWYTNVPEHLTGVFSGVKLFGHSSYREVQIFVDGVLVDTIMPIPTIYTGGINPGLWKPIVHSFAYDLWEAEVDITLWVAGKSKAVIELRVEGLKSDGYGGLTIGGGIGQNWYVSGRAFLWTDPTEDTITLGDYSLKVEDPAIVYTEKIEGEGDEKRVSFTTTVDRTTTVAKKVGTKTLEWKHNQRYTIESTVFANGNNQSLNTFTYSNELSPRMEPYDSTFIQIRSLKSSLKIDSAFVTYPDHSFLLYGKVNSNHLFGGYEHILLTDKSPLLLRESVDDKFGLWESESDISLDDTSTYFAASGESHKTSWLTGKDYQSIKYKQKKDSFAHNRTVQSYGRKVHSNYTHVQTDIESINGKATKDIFSASAGREPRPVEIGVDEVLCINGPHGDRRGQRMCPERHFLGVV